jgi:hypothetical protein
MKNEHVKIQTQVYVNNEHVKIQNYLQTENCHVYLWCSCLHSNICQNKCLNFDQVDGY